MVLNCHTAETERPNLAVSPISSQQCLIIEYYCDGKITTVLLNLGLKENFDAFELE